MVQLLMVIFLSSSMATERASVASEAIATFSASKTNRELLDRVLTHVPAKEKASVMSFLESRKLRFDDKIVRAQVKGEGLRLITADGQIFSFGVVDPLKGHFNVSGLQLDLNRRGSPLQRLTQIENALSRRDVHSSLLLIPQAKAYVVGTLGSLVVGAFALFQIYQETAELRTLMKANYELAQAKKDCRAELAKIETGRLNETRAIPVQSQSSDLLSTRGYLNQISTSYICREVNAKPDTEENQKLGEGCRTIQEINNCIQELTLRSRAEIEKSGSIVKHAGRALKALAWRSDVVEVLKAPGSNGQIAH